MSEPASPPTTTRPQPRRAITGEVWAYAGAQIAAASASGLGLTVATVSAAELSGSDQIGGLAQTAMIVGASLLTVPIAALARHRGRRTSLVVAYLIAALGAAGASAAVAFGSWPMLLVALLAVGGGTVASLAARFAAADTADRESLVPQLMAFVLWASTIGSVTGPNLVSVLPKGNASAFTTMALLLATAAAIVAVFCRDRPVRDIVAPSRGGGPAPATSSAPAGAGEPNAAPLEDERPGRRRPLAGILAPLRVPAVRLGALLTTSSHAFMVCLMAMAPVHLHHEGTDPAVVGATISAHVAAMYALSPLFGWLVARVGPRLGGVFAGILFVASASTLLVATIGPLQHALFAVGIAGVGFAWSLGLISGSTIVTGAVAPAERLRAQSMTDLGINVGGGVASIIAGSVVAWFGYPVLSVVAIVLALALTGRFVAAVRERSPRTD